MKCSTCKVNEAKPGIIVCSDVCDKIRLTVNRLIDICTPTPGCDNCHGDLYKGCTEKCKKEFRESNAFAKELWLLVRTELNKKL